MSRIRSTNHGGARTRPTIIDEIHNKWLRDNGYKVASVKPEDLHAVNTQSFKLQAEKKSPKLQAPSSKPQASSRKRQAP